MNTLLGVLQADSGDFAGAMESFVVALDKCEHINNPLDYSVVWLAVSEVLVNWGMADLALSVLKLTQWYVSQVPLNQDLRTVIEAMVHNNLAVAHLTKGQYSAGLRACRVVLRNQPPSERPFEVLNHANALRNFVNLLLRVNDLSEAERQVQNAKALLRRSAVPARGALAIESAEASLEVYSGETHRGIRRIKSCLARAQANHSHLEGPFLRTLIELLSVAGRNDEAAVRKKQLADLVARVSCDNALFHHRRHVAGLQLAESAEAKSNTFTPETHLRHRHLTTTGPFEVLENLATVAEAHDDPSGDHPRRVGELSFHLAKRLDLSPEACDQIRKAAPLHDVGKVGIPAEILSKVEPLSPEEVEIVRRHTRVGAELLQSTGEIELGTAIEVALHHHEWWDGSGYPLGLAGNSIPIAARIAAIAECFDAMTHDRVYRPKLSPYRALELIRERAGRQFDPLLVDKFHEVIGEQLGNGSDIDAFLLRDSGNQTSTFVRAKRRLLGRLKDSLPSQTRELHLL